MNKTLVLDTHAEPLPAREALPLQIRTVRVDLALVRRVLRDRDRLMTYPGMDEVRG
jgi:hypothetical protein